MDFQKSFRDAKAARKQFGNSSQTSSRNAIIQGEDDMPPPPPRQGKKSAQFHDDSQMTQNITLSNSVAEPSVNYGTVQSDVGVPGRGPSTSEVRMRPNHTSVIDENDQIMSMGTSHKGIQEGTRSVEGSTAGEQTLPAGFFESGQTQKRQKTSMADDNDEYSMFMKEIDGLGDIVKEKTEDGERILTHKKTGHAGNGTAGAENEGQDGMDGIQEQDTSESDNDLDDFEQFVRKERLLELKSTLTAKGSQAIQAESGIPPEEEIQNALQLAGIAPEMQAPEIQLPKEQSVAQSFKEVMEQADTSDEDEGDADDWRVKGFTT